MTALDDTPEKLLLDMRMQAVYTVGVHMPVPLYERIKTYLDAAKPSEQVVEYPSPEAADDIRNHIEKAFKWLRNPRNEDDRSDADLMRYLYSEFALLMQKYSPKPSLDLKVLSEVREDVKRAVGLLSGDMIASGIEILEKQTLAKLDELMKGMG